MSVQVVCIVRVLFAPYIPRLEFSVIVMIIITIIMIIIIVIIIMTKIKTNS